jgi:rhamnulokinase
MIADGAGRPVTLGAAEATVLGNLGMQAAATGEVEGLDAFHQILRESFPQEVLIPGDPGPWEEEYRKRQREEK